MWLGVRGEIDDGLRDPGGVDMPGWSGLDDGGLASPIFRLRNDMDEGKF